MNYAIKHSTKGYFQHPDNWIVNHENAYKWASRFDTIDQAREAAKGLTALDGKPLKRVQIVNILPPQSEYKFESYNVVETIEQ